MTGSPSNSTVNLAFDDVVIDVHARFLLKAGEKAPLGPRPLDVLVYLIENRDRLVTKQELFEQIWGTDFVTDSALAQAIKEIRLALGDDAQSPKYVRTVHRKGYQFIAPLGGEAPPGKPRRRAPHVALSLLAAAILVLAVSLWISPPSESARTGEPAPDLSLAVLPFANRSADPHDAYFVDGIHDDLLNHVSQIGAIRTISRTSVMRYRDTDKPISEIANELGVSNILEGGIQRSGGQVRINVQLIDARNDAHLWAAIYDRELTAENLFAIQSETSKAISSALEAVLTPEERDRIEAIPTRSLEAYEAYLLGKQSMANRTSSGLDDAVEHLSRAVALDPGFALAWSTLADVYLIQRANVGPSESELLRKAKAAVDRAIELDPGLGEAHNSLGMLRWNFDDARGAEDAYLRAIDLAPNYARTYYWYAILLRAEGRDDEAFEMTSMALKRAPITPVVRIFHTYSLRKIGRHREAVEELEKLLEIDPQFKPAYDSLATIDYMVFNRMARSIQGYARVAEMDPNDANQYAWAGQVYLELGMADRARLLFEKTRKLQPDALGAHWGNVLLAAYQEGMGEVEAGAEGVEKDQSPGPWITQFSMAQVRNQLLAEGQLDRAIAVYSEHYPQLLDDPGAALGTHNFRAAIDLALVLQMTGEQERAASLLERAAAFVKTRHRLGWHGAKWVSDVQILALQGRPAEALDALRAAVDEGWRSLWWYYLKHDPNLESIRGELAFREIVAEIEADMAAQRQEVIELERAGELSALQIDFPGSGGYPG